MTIAEGKQVITMGRGIGILEGISGGWGITHGVGGNRAL